MNETEKIYKNAGIKPIDIAEYGSTYIPKKIEINGKPYPPFTAEKQIELIKWLADRPLSLIIGRRRSKYYFGNSNFSSKADVFEEALAGRINDLWYFITEEEKQQVKGILNG